MKGLYKDERARQLRKWLDAFDGCEDPSSKFQYVKALHFELDEAEKAKFWDKVEDTVYSTVFDIISDREEGAR